MLTERTWRATFVKFFHVLRHVKYPCSRLKLLTTHKSCVTQIFWAHKSGVTQISQFIMLSYVTCGVRFCCSVLVWMLVAVLTRNFDLDVVQKAACWLIKSYVDLLVARWD